MLCYAHEYSPILLDPVDYPSISLGVDRFLPVSLSVEGQPRHIPSQSSAAPTSFLAYTRNCFLGRIMETLLEKAGDQFYWQTMYENSMGDAVKGMAVQGFGFTWLPESIIAPELANGSLVIAADEDWAPEFEIRLYRSKQRNRSNVEDFWRLLHAEKTSG